MTTQECTTLVKKETLIKEYWLKYCETKSPWFYKKWAEAKGRYNQYRTKLKEKYQGHQLTFNSK